VFLLAAAGQKAQQQTTGIPGSPSATTTIEGHLLIKLLEAGDPDNFNRQRVMPLDDGKLDNLTEGQVRQILAWLRKRIQVAESINAQRQPAAAKPRASKFPAVFRGDGWPYKREKQRKR
jgi:hypothetical protein